MKRSGESKRLWGSVSGRLIVARTPATAGSGAAIETRIVGACAATQIRQWVAFGPPLPACGCAWRIAAVEANTANARHNTAAHRCQFVLRT